MTESMNPAGAAETQTRTVSIGLENISDEVSLSNVNAMARIGLASPQLILEWSRRHRRQTERYNLFKAGTAPKEIDESSFGEVKKPETINYRTFKPERDGLFCERIFGPIKDWECACGKYKRIKYKGIICDRCGVEVTESRVRRVRMGHIKLAAPVCHIWFYKGTSSKIGHLLEISAKDLHKVVYFQEYIVVDPGDTPLRHKQLLIEEEYRKYKELYGDKVKIGIGAEAIKEMLGQLDIEDLANRLNLEMREAKSAQKRAKIIKRLKIIEAFRNSGNNPQWMVIEVLPVLPPDLRPLVHLEGGRFATSDLNDLYRRVINRNNRLKRLIEIKAPEVILRNEKRMLQEAVDALFDNTRRTRPLKGHNNRPLKSLSDMLKGKQGRFRQNLLGKRVDYSGRSVIVVGPELKFNECGLPKKMALELFDPFIIRELERRGHAPTIKTAKKLIEEENPVVFDVLEEIIRDHPVMLNRAPTLHRLGIQAFMPKLVEGKAIRLHPLSCAAFNADFDGDQMAVHVPLSVEAILEAKLIMLAHNNILSPASGRPIAVPSQDMVLGLYYLTQYRRNTQGEGMVFGSPEEAILAHELGKVHLQARIKVRINGKLVETSPGRLIFNEVLPPEISYFNDKNPFANSVMVKKSLGQLVALAHRYCGKEKTAEMLDNMKNLGFRYAQRSGVSISINDLKVPATKAKILEKARADAEKIRQQYIKGQITDEERYHKIVDLWTHATDRIAEDLRREISGDQEGFNPIFIMQHSGARGSFAQIRQLAGARGLMQRPTKKITGAIGEIIEAPITSNFREGLTVLEYFISTHGARKGLADTALKTSDAGYLTRRLCDIAQELMVTSEDCGTRNFITVRPLVEITTLGERELEPLRDRVIGRVAARTVKDPKTGEIICKRNQEITEEIADRIDRSGVTEVDIRSVLTCESRQGICARCYGMNLAKGCLVEVGEAVGIIAAQSIGEPGTQLTLRTFHIGGTASRELEGWYQASFSGTVRFQNIETLTTADNKQIIIKRGGSIILTDDTGVERQNFPSIPYGAQLNVKDGDHVEPGQQICRWDPHHIPIIAEREGVLKFHDIIAGVTLKKVIDPQTGIEQNVISEHREEAHPELVIQDSKGNIIDHYALSAGTILNPEMRDGMEVQIGQTLARLPRIKTRSRDITGGLPRVDELFEARKPKDAAFISEVNGVFRFKGIHRGMRKVAITTEDGKEHIYNVPLARHIIVRDGEFLEKGEPFTDGSINPHDILAIQGEKAVQEFLLSEIQEVYRIQGVGINDKHIECIIRQMMKKVIITDVGSTRFLFGEQVDRWEFEEENERVKAAGGEPAKARPRLLGLTKASLDTSSFISAASFQETTRVLTNAAIQGAKDYLRGLKENVIMGLLIPAGTGMPRYRNVEILTEPDYKKELERAAAEEQDDKKSEESEVS
ncbi:MAG: DNA-directed RNA polymerase subunit beta' [Candidatus Sumerlaeia bacterium]